MKANGICRLQSYLIALILITPGITIAGETASNTTPLHTAIAELRNNDAEHLIQQGTDVNALNKWGMTPVFSAGSRNNLEGAKLLLQKGASLEVINQDGETPIFWAVKGGSADIVQLYLDNGARLDVKDKNGNTPLNIAVINHYRGYQKKYVHIKRERSDLIDTLIEHGADINAIDNNGENILHYVAVNGDADTLRFLLTLSANPNLVDAQGHTPLEHARMYNNTAAISLLSGDTNLIESGIIGSPYSHVTQRLSDGICEQGSVRDFTEGNGSAKICFIKLTDNLGIAIEGLLFAWKSGNSDEVHKFSFMYDRQFGQTRQVDITLLVQLVDSFQPELNDWVKSTEFLVKFGENSRTIPGNGFSYISGGDSSGWSITKDEMRQNQQSTPKTCPEFAFYRSHDVRFFEDHWVSRPVVLAMPGSPVAEISFTKYDRDHVLFKLRVSEDNPLRFNELEGLNAQILLETGKIDIADAIVTEKSVDLIITMESFRALTGTVGFELSNPSQSQKYVQVGFQARSGLSPIYEAAENHWNSCWGAVQ